MKENTSVIGYVGTFNGLKVYETNYFDNELKNQGCIQIIGGKLYMINPLDPVAGFEEITGEVSIYNPVVFEKEFKKLAEFKKFYKKVEEYKEVEKEQVKDADVIDDLLSKVEITCDNLLKDIQIDSELA